MMPHSPDGAGSDGAPEGAGAMADIILGTTGILLVLLAALGPLALARQGSASAPNILDEGQGPVVEGHAGPVLLATAQGLAVHPGGALIPVSEISSSPHLAALGAARPLLIIEADGLEAAFHASARLAAAGIGEIDRVRMTGSCAGPRRVEDKGGMLVLACKGR